MPSDSENYLFADDLAITAQHKKIAEAQRIAQAAANELQSWTRKWKQKLAADKSESILFTIWSNETNKEVPITIGGETIKTSKYATFVGVTLDRLLNFGEHVKRTRAKIRPRLRQLTALCRRNWGARESTLRSVYLKYIRSAMEYAGGA